jgi:hypothetical protein
MFSSQKKRRVKQYARATAFDVNVNFDIRQYQKVKFGGAANAYFPAVASDESFNVKEGEILMAHSGSQVKYNTHQMHCFSFANGLGENTDTHASILEKLKYAGVAVTEFSPSKDVYEQGFVSNLAGLNTLFNNGKDTIHPGDLVCADIPDQGMSNKHRNRALQGGVPREKLQFVIRPHNKMITDLASTLGGPSAQFIADQFIIGTAVEYARPGNPVSVILHHCNHSVRIEQLPAGASSSSAPSGSSPAAPSSSSRKSKKGKQ